MEETDSFSSADSIFSRSRGSTSFHKSRSRQLTSRLPNHSRPQPSNLFSSAPSPSPSPTSSSNSRQSSPASYRSVHAASLNPSNVNVSSAPSPSDLVSSPANPSTGDSVHVSSPSSPSVHSLRSNTQYSHQEIYTSRNQLFLNAFWQVYRSFLNQTPISEEARQQLESFNVTEEEFTQLVVDRELEDGRYISLLDNKIVFDECTKSPHGEIIMEIGAQIGLQDRAAGSLFIAGTGNRIALSIHFLYKDITLTPGTSDKAPDGHWQLSPARIPPQFRNSFPLNPRSGLIAPGLVLEVAVSNETMPVLTQIDLGRYFAAGTGTRVWIGVKIFCDDRNNPPTHRWWCGWAARDQAQNGVFLNIATLHAESMPIVTSHNTPLATPTNPPLIFHIDVRLLVHPMPTPQGYPATLDVNMELVRQLALSLM
jgi:hypothetical protein